MKKIKHIPIAILTILSICFPYACSKSFLSRPALGSLSEETLANQKGIDALLVGAYSALDGQNVGGGTWESSPDNWIYGSVAGGDAHKGSFAGDQPAIDPIVRFISDPSNGFFNAKYRACYEGVARANAVLKTIAKTENLDPAFSDNAQGQARFLRGHYYFELKKMFNKVPWIDETSTDFKAPNTEDIWPKIEDDFKFAMEKTNETQPNAGQANKWAAAAYLAKTYMFQDKYGDAKPIFDQIISQGKTSKGETYGLTAKFEDNFDAATKNNKESVFAVQYTANDGTGGIANANAGDMLNFPYGDSPFGCCGFYQPTQDLVNAFRTDPDGLPYLDNYNSVPVKNDQGIASSQPFTPYAGTLDPRLDWTAGRRGLPYHDWGLHPGQKWIRDQTYAGPYAPKKHIYWQATQDEYSDRNSWAPGSAINYVLIRFSDVLLMAAEAEAEVGSLDKAEEYVNMVRARAANPQGWLYKYIDDADPLAGFSNEPAANYEIDTYPTGTFTTKGKDYAVKAIRFERRLELGMEGHRFFDLVRWGNAKEVLDAYFQYEGTVTSDIQGATFKTGKNEYYPIPQAQIDLSFKDGTPTLTQNSGY